MSLPGSDSVVQRCRAAIPTLLEAWDLDAVGTIRGYEDGGINPCFFVGQDYVLRFNVRDYGIPKFRREAAAYRRLVEGEVPVPEVVFLDESRECVPYDVIALERLAGSGKGADGRGERLRLCRRAGDILAELHACEFERFGEVWCAAHQRWGGYLRRRVGTDVRQAVRYDVITSDEASRLWDVLAGCDELLDSVEKPRLVHGDYHPENLIADESGVTGVVDFEWCMAGDPEWDLAMIAGDEDWTGAGWEAFQAGYGRSIEPRGALRARWTLYRLICNLEISLMARDHLTAGQREAFRAQIGEQLAELEER